MMGQLRSTPGFKEIQKEIESEDEANQNAPQDFGVNYYGY